MLTKLPDGTKGFDCNVPLTDTTASLMKCAGYDFVVRYVRREVHSQADISLSETLNILQSGLGLMLVQHVALPGWSPSYLLGAKYGATAVEHANSIGYPPSALIWCDLEGVKLHTPHTDVIAFCNAWYDAVSKTHYEPGLYVGYQSGLTAEELFRKLRFKRYWSGYNLNKDEFPAVRGVQMKQLPYPPRDKRVAGIHFEYDEDVIHADALGGSPLVLLK